MPKVIDGDAGSQSFAVSPSEIATMPSDMDCLRFSTSGSGKPWAELKFPDNSERHFSVGYGHCGRQVLGDGSTVADVSQHHRILHRPCIIAIHKSDETIVAIRATGRMVCINGLAFDKQSVVRGNHGTRLFGRISELE